MPSWGDNAAGVVLFSLDPEMPASRRLVADSRDSKERTRLSSGCVMFDTEGRYSKRSPAANRIVTATNPSAQSARVPAVAIVRRYS